VSTRRDEGPGATRGTALDPELHAERVAYCLLPSGAPMPAARVIASFVEGEGTTVVVTMDDARAHALDIRFVAEWITLRLPTALDAVGITAAVSRALADEGIPCNVIAAVHHDHLFVPAGDGARAMNALAGLRWLRGQST
jgi:hypothetical protein